MPSVIAWLSRMLNAARLYGRAAHRRRVHASRRVLRTLRRWTGDDVAARLFGYIRKLDPLVFEELVLTALEDGGRLVLRNRRYAGDGGIDGRVYLPGLGWAPVQVKRYRSHIDNRDVEALAKLVRRRRSAVGVFVHAGRTGAASYRHLGPGRIVLVSGERLVDLLLQGALDLHGAGVAPARGAS